MLTRDKKTGLAEKSPFTDEMYNNVTGKFSIGVKVKFYNDGLFLLSQTSSFQSVIKNRQTKKTSHFFVYSRRTTQDRHHTSHGDRGGPSYFCTPLTFFDAISSFAARGH